MSTELIQFKKKWPERLLDDDLQMLLPLKEFFGMAYLGFGLIIQNYHHREPFYF